MPPNPNKASSSSSALNNANNTNKEFTWQEIAQHNTAKSCWVYIGNKVYDITEWVDKHPGGRNVLLLAAGRDITDLFHSYHPFTDKPSKILEKYEIGNVKTAEFMQFPADSGFYRTLCQRVGNYFKQTRKDYKDPSTGLLYLAMILIVAFASFAVGYDPRYHWLVRVFAAQLFGVCQALPLLHMMHDASHTAIGPNEKWWLTIGRLTMDWFAGASLTSWYNQHILGHHVYTNVMGADPDLPATEKGDIRRVMPKQAWAKFYEYQHIYLLFLYGLLGFKFRVQDIVGIFTRQNGAIRVNVDFAYELTYQISVKLFWFSWRILLPIYLWKIPIGQLIVLLILSELVTGWYLAFNFQVSHVSPVTDFSDLQSEKRDEWAVTQVKTTVDYAHGNPIATFLCGALNYQTVHHLFPCVSQYHYPAIAPIIKDVCNKYKIHYNEVPTFTEAFLMHVKHLKQMGVKALDHSH